MHMGGGGMIFLNRVEEGSGVFLCEISRPTFNSIVKKREGGGVNNFLMWSEGVHQFFQSLGARSHFILHV